MLDEIIEMREKGISFRKIAKELGTTVGKVQYQWVKYQKVLESGSVQIEPAETITEKKNQDIRIGKVKRKASLKSGRQSRKPIMEDFTITYSTGARIYCYWTISKDWLDHLKDRFNLDGELPFILRLYDITSIIFNGHNHHSYRDSYVPSTESDWFINGLKDNRSYCMDLGVRIPSGEFIAIKRSNVIHTPRTAQDAEYHSLRELKEFEQGRVKEPKWVEHVSTYSYYVMEQEDKA
ncbi:hypothetical protein AS034_05490 [[Bacillus] enclensis]|uniref:DUF4912 domain-containing protein n=2 Tax=Rossellomorea TaxID=2837508 RepID=A0A0V8HMR9_9BACI|nr:DUF4912 domain-containing protein [[Bacillus] enclensis]OAT84238.1 hypothetical protein A6P54_02810 [Bacillus sp. MKU004]QTC43505.1 DUF4912 domain-containing protein [Bacillus sp. V3]QWC21677.1 DUF4912 domain-containing protein [Bacillus haikouensis]KSU63698.1 hypothetical protein AS034_05490 [[Bacillus] enclensis]MBH9967451.1 DUF4912 domain-containing protein [[Bacillus] enclensis]